MSRIPEPFTVHARPGRSGEWEVSLNSSSGLTPPVCSAWRRRSLRAAPPEFLASIQWPRTAVAARRTVLALIEHLRSTGASPVSRSGIPIGDYVRLFQSAVTSPRARKLEARGRPYSPTTVENYRDRIERHILTDTELCALPMAGVTVADLEAFFARLSRKLGGPCRTLQDVWGVLRMIFRQFVTDHPGTPDPFLSMTKPTYKKTVRGALVEDELVAIFSSEGIFETPLERAVCALAFWAGLRRGEVFALRWEDVDFGGRRIAVRRAWKRFGAAVAELGDTKGRKDRIVPLAQTIAEALENLRGAYGQHEYVCSRPDGSLPSAGWWDDHVQAVLDRAGIDRAARAITPHSARHSLASVLESRGIQPRYIKEILGHQDEHTTEGYLHMAAAEIDKATMKINKKAKKK